MDDEHNERKPARRDYFLPASIVIAAVLVSVALVYNAGKKPDSGNLAGALAPDAAQQAVAGSPSNMKPVSASDHIRGNLNAPVKIVEFSDLECPFCKQFDGTLKQVLQTYGDKVAWIYRHSPLDALHPKARKEAEASECANELGGNDKFWAYIDRLYELTPSNNGLDPALLPKIATDVGLDGAKFQACLSSGKYAAHVASDLADAEASGGGGTPYSIVIGRDGKKYLLMGAYPMEQVKTIIDKALQ